MNIFHDLSALPPEFTFKGTAVAVGNFDGVHIGHRSVLDPTPGPSRIFLYRRAILDEWAERGDVTLAELVSHVLVH